MDPEEEEVDEGIAAVEVLDNEAATEPVVAESEGKQEEEDKAEVEELEKNDDEEVDFEVMKVDELKRALKKNGLPTNGRKIDLIKRLRSSCTESGPRARA